MSDYKQPPIIEKQIAAQQKIVEALVELGDHDAIAQTLEQARFWFAPGATAKKGGNRGGKPNKAGEN